MEKPADDPNKLIIPTINANGTHIESLLRQVTETCRDLISAEVSLGYMSPHGRDYLPQGGPDFLKAAEQHSARRLAVRKVIEELQEIAKGIARQRRSHGPL